MKVKKKSIMVCIETSVSKGETMIQLNCNLIDDDRLRMDGSR